MPARPTTAYNFYVIKGDDMKEHIPFITDANGQVIDTSQGMLSAVFESSSGVSRFELSNNDFVRLDDYSFYMKKSRNDDNFAALPAGATLVYQVKYVDGMGEKITLMKGTLTIEDTIE